MLTVLGREDSNFLRRTITTSSDWDLEKEDTVRRWQQLNSLVIVGRGGRRRGTGTVVEIAVAAGLVFVAASRTLTEALRIVDRAGQGLGAGDLLAVGDDLVARVDGVDTLVVVVVVAVAAGHGLRAGLLVVDSAVGARSAGTRRDAGTAGSLGILHRKTDGVRGNAAALNGRIDFN